MAKPLGTSGSLGPEDGRRRKTRRAEARGSHIEALTPMPEPKKPGEYLVATDGSPASDKAVDFAIARAKEAGARLVIIMAVEGNMMGTPSSGGSSSVDLSVQIEKEGWAKVRKDEERARAAGVQARAEIVKVYPPNDIAVAIVKYAEEKRVHSVFVGSHGRTGLSGRCWGRRRTRS